MKLLALDTSTDHLSVAISDDEDILCSKGIETKKTLSSLIMPTIDECLKQVKMELSDLSGFVVGLGPGSFTSLRVGLATIKGLNFATGKPVVGISSLDAIACNVESKRKEICVVTDARRKMVYSCLYKNNGSLERIGEHLLAPIEDVLTHLKGEIRFVGNGIDLYKDEIKAAFPEASYEDEEKWLPTAEGLARLAQIRFKNKNYDKIEELVPLYLYKEDCQVHR